jgi:transposase
MDSDETSSTRAPFARVRFRSLFEEYYWKPYSTVNGNLVSEVGGSILKISASKESHREEVRSRTERIRTRAVAQAHLGGECFGEDAQPRSHPAFKADVGKHAQGRPLIDREIAPMLETSTATVQRVRERFCRQGLDAALERSAPDRLYERTFDGRAEARLIALACSRAPEGRERWSLRLLADKAVEMGIVEEVSHETIRKTLKKTSSSPTR